MKTPEVHWWEVYEVANPNNAEYHYCEAITAMMLAEAYTNIESNCGSHFDYRKMVEQ